MATDNAARASRHRFVSEILSSKDLDFKTALAPDEMADRLVLHISCQVLQVPHIPQIAQSIIKYMGIRFTTVGGAEFCCGAYHRYAGDDDFESKIAKSSLHSIGAAGAKEFVSFCPSCDDSFERNNRRPDLRQLNITQFLIEHLDQLKRAFRPLPYRVLLHQHRVDANRQRDAANIRRLLEAIPGLRIVTADAAEGEGLGCQSFRPMSLDQAERMFQEARRRRADFVAVPYHNCYRQHCKMQLEHGIEVQHYLGLLAKAMRIDYEETFKELRMLNNVENAVTRVRRRAAELCLQTKDVETFIRRVVYS